MRNVILSIKLQNNYPNQSLKMCLGFTLSLDATHVPLSRALVKKAAWKVYIEHLHLFEGLGRDRGFEQIEEFVCRLYNVADPFGGVDKGRHDIFVKGKKSLEMLPPTEDSLQLHWERSNYQAKIWLQADLPVTTLGDPSGCGGWTTDANRSVIVWT